MQPAPEPTVPDQFGPYEVYERLGIGGMATVYRAKKRGPAGFERSVALKRMLSHLAEDASFVESFIREAKVASLLVHPNIAQVYDFGRIGGIYYIAMELVAGYDLRKLLRHANRAGEALPLAAVLSILGELADALEYAHTCADEEGTPLHSVHRDISPSNMIVAHTGHLKVIDFGIAKAASQQLHTESGQAKGKLGYMSPEAALGIASGPVTDVFSMGVVAWELVTAQPLFSARTDFETMRRIREMEIPPPSRYNPASPPELDQLILAALDRDDRRRLPSAGEFRRGLDAIIARAGVQISARAMAEWMRHFLQPGELVHGSEPAEAEASTAVLRPGGRARLQRSPDEAQLATEIWGEDAQTVAPGPDFSADGSQPFAIPVAPAVAQAATTGAPPAALAPAPRRRRAGLALVAALASIAAGLAGALWWKHHHRSAAAQPQLEVPAGPVKGAVQFAVEPAGAIIEIGGKEVARSSPYVAELDPGVYSVTVHEDGFRPWTTTLAVNAGDHRKVDVALERGTAHLSIDSQPPGLAIELDGHATSYVTPATFDAAPGTHRIEVVDARGARWSHELTAALDSTYAFTATFPGAPAAPPGGHHVALAGTPVPHHDAHASDPAHAPVTEATPPPPPPPADVHIETPPPVVATPPPPVPARPARTPIVAATAVTKLAGELPVLHGDHDAQALVKMCIDERGAVSAATVVHATGPVPPSLTAALRGWRYRPYVNQAGVISPACFVLSLHLVVQPDD